MRENWFGPLRPTRKTLDPGDLLRGSAYTLLLWGRPRKMMESTQCLIIQTKSCDLGKKSWRPSSSALCTWLFPSNERRQNKFVSVGLQEESGFFFFSYPNVLTVFSSLTVYQWMSSEVSVLYWNLIPISSGLCNPRRFLSSLRVQ